LPVLLVVGAILRLAFIPDAGFKSDVSSFEAWAIQLAEHPFWQFYPKIGFADYPPGYYYVLAPIGLIWELLFRHFDTSYGILEALVKLPAIVADLLVTVLIYKIVLRFATQRWALIAAAVFALNPAAIFISGLWGQIDSIPGGLALLAVYLLVRSDDRPERARWYVAGAWLALAYSLFIKPQAAVLIPLLIAFALIDPVRRRERLSGSAIGIVASLFLVYVLSAPFYSTLNPAIVFANLFEQYAKGAAEYAYNSVNAFNLWTIRQGFWQPDSVTTFGVPQWLIGMFLATAAAVLILWRYVQTRTSQALLESAALLLLAFYMLSTRMHERYIFEGLIFTIACIGFARRYFWIAIALSLVLWANLDYSLAYLAVASGQAISSNSSDLWGLGDHLLSLANVVAFFWLGYTFFGTDAAVATVGTAATAGVTRARAVEAPTDAPAGARGWFDPTEGLIGMKGWVDWAIAGALGLGSFVLSFVNYWIPTGKVFDEIYFARAGEEYLKHLPIYESTHPPLAKLLVTLSMVMFGGLHGWGDTSIGWRFLDVLFGAFVVVLLYVFAKRLTGSRVFATIASVFLIADGMHFVQSRIATPEGFVVFFSLAAVYAFYRFWICEQVSVRAHADDGLNGRVLIAAGASVILGGLLGYAIVSAWFHQSTAATAVAAFYFACGIYLLLRLAVLPRMFGGDNEEIGYAEGSYAIRKPNGAIALHTADGGVLDSTVKTPRRGAVSQHRAGSLYYEAENNEIVYARDGTVTYRTPEGEAVYTPGVLAAAGTVLRGREARFWLVAFTVALGCLVASKWYGVMGFGVSFVLLIAIWLQRYIVEGRRPALWGNPRGFRLDVALVSIVFISATVYGLSWTKDLSNHVEIKNLSDVVYRQYSMFHYHDTLTATHPYSSKWYEWPIDWVPIAYFYQDLRIDKQNDTDCKPPHCIYEITSMPNPLNMWFGLLCVPFVGFLAWYQKRKGYALIVLTYLMQWLPWMKSPRIAFAYHFYVDIPLICLCNAIALQWLWKKASSQDDPVIRGLAIAGIVLVVACIVGAFVFFYPILADQPLSWNAWHLRMWRPTWVIGPG
jgi:dolichyl-phosphate-mannose--protein O-mannosyl transferase